MAHRAKSHTMLRIERLRGRPIEDDLRQLYVTDNQTQEAIATLYGLNVSTVNRWLDRFDIPSRRWAHVTEPAA